MRPGWCTHTQGCMVHAVQHAGGGVGLLACPPCFLCCVVGSWSAAT